MNSDPTTTTDRNSTTKSRHSKPQDWTEDSDFYDWLISINYARKAGGMIEVESFLSLSTVLHMHRAFLAGFEKGKTR